MTCMAWTGLLLGAGADGTADGHGRESRAAGVLRYPHSLSTGFDWRDAQVLTKAPASPVGVPLQPASQPVPAPPPAPVAPNGPSTGGGACSSASNGGHGPFDVHAVMHDLSWWGTPAGSTVAPRGPAGLVRSLVDDPGCRPG
jgi:hypothetical protein